MPSLLGVQSAPPPYWPAAVEKAVAAIKALGGPAVIVAHSAAGAIVPAISKRARSRIAAYVFVDASLPALPGEPPPDDSPFHAHLVRLAEDGVLPPWSRWFGPGVMEQLVPDAAIRSEVERELPRLPLAYFDEPAPVPRGWPEAPCGYLLFSGAYANHAAEAERRGWLLRALAGQHLHMLVDPGAVAMCLVEMADALAVGRRPEST